MNGHGVPELDACLAAARRRFGEARVLVVGDVMLDGYVWGEVSRISPEAPVPIVRVTKRDERLGGAANVALNLAMLGARVELCGVVGADEAGAALRAMARRSGIGVEGVLRMRDRPTTTKVRVIGGHQHVLRIDEESVGALDADTEAAVVRSALALMEAFSLQVLVLSDYAKGVAGGELCATLIDAARRRGVPVIVDPKGADFSRYLGATAITPNLGELAAATGAPADDLHALHGAAARLRGSLGLDFIALTRGPDGISLVDDVGARHFPAVAREVFDVSGAGDTVVATLAAALAAALPVEAAIGLANVAAGVAVGRLGTYAISAHELVEALSPQDGRIHGPEDWTGLAQRIASWRAAGERIVFTNGCFDLLHVGHIRFLAHARATGDRLVVGLNTDRWVRALKGPGRPVIPEQERARLLAALERVDAVVLFDQQTPLELILAVRPDVVVRGSDHAGEFVGAREVGDWGGRISVVPVDTDRSISKLLRAIRAYSGEAGEGGLATPPPRATPAGS
jgi:D-beta-D-heptose 7-phosphate kinase/D-beta-D-heptose 1-phosphate adenosyltransferase